MISMIPTYNYKEIKQLLETNLYILVTSLTKYSQFRQRLWKTALFYRFVRYHITTQPARTTTLGLVFNSPLEQGCQIVIPKIPIWAFVRGPWNGKCWHILWSFSCSFGIFPPFWYVLPREIWQPWPRVELRFLQGVNFVLVSEATLCLWFFARVKILTST
jgi:hypothetical protein